MINSTRNFNQRVLLQAILSIAGLPSGYRLWLGLWSSQQVQSIPTHLIPKLTTSQLSTLLLKLGRILFTGAHSLHTQLLQLAPRHSNAPQSSTPPHRRKLTQFFSRSKIRSSSSNGTLLNSSVCSFQSRRRLPTSTSFSQTSIESFLRVSPSPPPP
jgi:hypothetical protein